MGKGPQAILGAVLLILAGIGIWIGSKEPETEVPPSPIEGQAGLHARALLRIEAVIADRPDSDPEIRWLTSEMRYLLVRGQVPLARPQGPYDPEDGEALFTLRVTAAEEPAAPLQLTLVSPSGTPERTVTAPPLTNDRLGRIQAIAHALPALLPRGATGVGFPAFLGTTSAAAYEALAQAQMAAFDESELKQSQIAIRATPIDRLEALTREQPGFARAWAELALLYLRIAGQDVASLTAIAERAAQRAVELDSRLAEAHAVLGIARQRRGEWVPADVSLAQALALDPASPTALEAFSCLLVDVGRIHHARLIGEQAVSVAPGSRAAAECLAYARLATGESLTGMGTTPDLAARPRVLSAMLMGRPDEARASLAALHDPPEGFDQWFSTITQAIGQPSRRPDALRAITRAASDATLDPATEIVYGVGLQQPDFVFNRLQRLKTQREAVPTRILWVKDALFLREHPRFAALTRSLGLDNYWKERGRPDLCGSEPVPAFCP